MVKPEINFVLLQQDIIIQTLPSFEDTVTVEFNLEGDFSGDDSSENVLALAETIFVGCVDVFCSTNCTSFEYSPHLLRI